MLVGATRSSWNGWSGQGFLQCPSFFQPSVQAAIRHAQGVRPFNHGARLSVPCDDHVGTAIAGLLCGRGPSAILRRVRTIIIDAIQLMFGSGACAHVGEKVIEQSPSVTDRNPACSIVYVPFIARIKASGFHGTPDVILRRICLSMSQAVPFPKVTHRLEVLARRFSMQASARFDVTISQVTQAQRRVVAALATAAHKALSAGRSTNHSQNRQAVVGESNNIHVSHALHCMRWYQNGASCASAALCS